MIPGNPDSLVLAAVDWQYPFIGLVLVMLFVAIVLMLRSKAEPRQEVNIVRAVPPVRKPGDPAFVERRAKAAAAAMVLHRKRHTSGEL